MGEMAGFSGASLQVVRPVSRLELGWLGQLMKHQRSSQGSDRHPVGTGNWENVIFFKQKMLTIDLSSSTYSGNSTEDELLRWDVNRVGEKFHKR